MGISRTFLRTSTAAAALIAFAAPVPVLAQTQTFEFNLPAQTLDRTLRSIARQTRQQVTFEQGAVQGKAAPEVKGSLTADQALRTALAGSGLEASKGRSGLFIIRPTGTPQGNAVAGAPNAGTESASSSGGDLGGIEDALNQTITVTGSRIRNQKSIGSPLITISKEDISRSGQTTVQGVLAKLPQNFNGGATEQDFTDRRAPNRNGGTAVNLRGLGIDSTLVLVNGYRQAPGDVNGGFVDVSTIAASAVEKIEILPDGASAIYGADAIGGVVNIILRKSYSGAESRLSYGLASGGTANEIVFSQLVGHNWSTGSLLVNYQYYSRKPLRRDKRPYSASDDFTRFGGSDFRQPFSNPANILDPNTFLPAFAIPTGQDGTSLQVSDLIPGTVNHSESTGDLLSGQTYHSVYFTGYQKLTDGLELFANGNYVNRDFSRKDAAATSYLFVFPSNPFYVDPFGAGFVALTYDFRNELGPIIEKGNTEALSAVLGATLSLPDAWQIKVAGSYSQESNDWHAENLLDTSMIDAVLADPDPATSFNPFGDGSNTNPATIELIRTTQRESGRARISDISAIADGALFSLPAGDAKVALGLDYRRETLLSRSAQGPSHSSRTIAAAFFELALPLLRSGEQASAEKKLEVSLAGRYEKYSDFGTTFNPKLGLNWRVAPPVNIRGSLGRSFKAPRLFDLVESPANSFALLRTIEDPQSASGFSTVLFRFGNNAQLQEERARTWSAGIDFKPSDSDFVSFGYYNIDYKGRVEAGGPENFRTLLQHEDEWAELITRSPSPESIAEICTSPLYLGSPGSCLATPIAAIADLRLRNLAIVRTHGFDFQLRSSRNTSLGTLSGAVNANYVLGFEQAVTRNSRKMEVVNTVHHPLRFRLRGNLAWERGSWNADVFVNYANSYKDSESVPERNVKSWTTVDLHVGHSFTFFGRSAKNGLALSVRNLFNTKPPFVNLPFQGYDTSNGDITGRVMSVELTRGW